MEIVDYGMTARRGDVNYAAVMRNPNETRWWAWLMPVRIDVLDKDGKVIASDEEFISLLPGQTGAVVGDISGVKGADTIQVAVANRLNDWIEYQWVTGGLDFSEVKTKNTRAGAKTSGRVESLFGDSQEGVQVMAVYRDRDGKVLGGDYTYLRIVPGAGSVPFKTQGAGAIPQRKIESTEVYFEQ